VVASIGPENLFASYLLHAGFFFILLFYSEDGDDMFFRKVG
jgi:hypothetical protein